MERKSIGAEGAFSLFRRGLTVSAGCGDSDEFIEVAEAEVGGKTQVPSTWVLVDGMN